MKKNVFILSAFFSVFFITNSCKVMEKETPLVSSNLSEFATLLKIDVYNDSLSNLGITLLPITIKNNHIGIYGYTATGPHRVYSKIIMYDGNTIKLTSIHNVNDLKYFLKTNSFSFIDKILLKKKLNIIRRHNKDVANSQIF